jgi:hypothetical protein
MAKKTSSPASPQRRAGTASVGKSSSVKNVPARKVSARAGFQENLRLQAILLFVVSFLLYAQTITFEYAIDDKIVISENKFVKEGGWSGLVNIFSRSSFDGHKSASQEKDRLSGGRYRPLTLGMFLMEYHLSGGKPALPHTINVLLYAVLVVVLFYVLHLLAKGNVELQRWKMLPLLVALVFAVHSAHTEVVANIKSRDEIVCLMASLLALRSYILAYRSWQLGGQSAVVSSLRLRHLLLSALWMLIALFAKETAITFVAVLPLAAWFCGALVDSAQHPVRKEDEAESLAAREQRSLFLPGAAVIALLPTLVAVAFFLAVRTSIVGFIDDRASTSIFDNPFLHATRSERYATAVAMLGRYALYTILPTTLSHEYTYKQLDVVGWSNWQTLTSLAVHMALVVYAAATFVRRSLLSFSIWVYVATISIVSNVVFSIGTLFGERFLFMPSVASSLGWVYVLALTVQRFVPAARGSSKVPWKFVYGVVGIWVLVLAYQSLMRIPDWRNENILIRADVQNTPYSLRNRRVLAGYLLRDAQNAATQAERDACLDESYFHSTYCLMIDSVCDDKAHFNLGQYYGMFRSNIDSAVYHYSNAHRLNPNDLTNLVYYTFNQGNRLILRQQYDSAIALYQSVMKYKIELATLYYNQAIAYIAKRNLDSGVALLKKVLEHEPTSTQALQARQGIAFYEPLLGKPLDTTKLPPAVAPER